MIAVGPPRSPLRQRVTDVLGRYGLAVHGVAPGAPVPGSYWGEPEAGLVGSVLHVRDDTPVHSALHEACHFVCMDAQRRARVDTDAGGCTLEECAVCYLSVVLAGFIDGFGRERMLADMDAWGYSFRLGSAAAWFEDDAGDARAWLERHGLVDRSARPTWQIRAGS